jgi:hypothetical protein
MRLTWKTVVAGVALGMVGVACDFSRPICGCTPSFYGAFVAGTVTDASGAPVANAPIMLIGTNVAQSFNPPSTPYEGLQKTTAEGKFATEVMGMGDLQEIRVAVYPPGRSVVVASAGSASFHLNSFGSDTVKVSITLPP